jgi:hypothetical protein
MSDQFQEWSTTLAWLDDESKGSLETRVAFGDLLTRISDLIALYMGEVKEEMREYALSQNENKVSLDGKDGEGTVTVRVTPPVTRIKKGLTASQVETALGTDATTYVEFVPKLVRGFDEAYANAPQQTRIILSTLVDVRVHPPRVSFK